MRGFALGQSTTLTSQDFFAPELPDDGDKLDIRTDS
jgi:hypothetical protein